MNTFQELMNEASRSASGFEIYHRLYSSAVAEAVAFAEKKGYEVDEDDFFNQVSTGPKKPSPGKTNSFNIQLKKNGKPVRRMLSFQIYGMDGGSKKQTNGLFELNVYIG